MDLSEIIKSQRDKLGLSRGELTIRSGVSSQYIKDIESGKRTNPSIGVLGSLGKVLKFKILIQIDE